MFFGKVMWPLWKSILLFEENDTSIHLIEAGITVLHDGYFEDKFPLEFDYKLYKENDFENQSNNSEKTAQDDIKESNISNDDSDAISAVFDNNLSTSAIGNWEN